MGIRLRTKSIAILNKSCSRSFSVIVTGPVSSGSWALAPLLSPLLSLEIYGMRDPKNTHFFLLRTHLRMTRATQLLVRRSSFAFVNCVGVRSSSQFFINGQSPEFRHKCSRALISRTRCAKLTNDKRQTSN